MRSLTQNHVIVALLFALLLLSVLAVSVLLLTHGLHSQMGMPLASHAVGGGP